MKTRLRLIAPPVVSEPKTPTWFGQLIAGLSVLAWSMDTIIKAVAI